ncbi:hypothetical protein BA190_29380 [Labrys sp. WJW]|uniref:ROK family transcriptional regulator n=1 Tax=Labrys sp. WJW TaxID=1737983 RepID=UPI000831D19D|nr:ROK family transcriptional regulator [Labrys sp. WJW]OCC01339.1 hypothetical protein BA190_29380 [Labrys sp. WJW]
MPIDRSPPLPARFPERRDQTSGFNLVQAADHNLRVTLEALRRGGAMTRLELAHVTGLTVPGIANILRRLTGDGLIETRSSARSTCFAIRPGSAVSIGVDLAGERARLIATDLAGTPLFAEDGPVGDATETAGWIRKAVSRLSQVAPGGRLHGIGLTAGEQAEPIRAALSPYRAIVERDTVAAAIGERQGGVAKADDSFVFILLGSTVRAGMIIGGTVFDGAEHKAGLVGLMRTGRDGRYLDEVAATSRLPSHDLSEAAVQQWLDEAAEHLTDMIIAMAAFIGPRLIVVGGRLPTPLLEALAARLQMLRRSRMIDPTHPFWLPEIRCSTLSDQGVVQGIAAIPFLDILLPDMRRPFQLR